MNYKLVQCKVGARQTSKVGFDIVRSDDNGTVGIHTVMASAVG